jgi:hypothetical protein
MAERPNALRHFGLTLAISLGIIFEFSEDWRLRSAVWVLLAIWCVCWTMCQWDLTPPEGATPPPCTWRRTVHGWERNTEWKLPPKPYEPTLHPLIVGSLQGLIAILALATFSPFRAEKNRHPVVGDDDSPRLASSHDAVSRAIRSESVYA